MLGRTGQRRRIKSGVNTRASRKEESKWGGVMYSRVFEGGRVDKEKKNPSRLKALAAKADFRRICTSSPILWFDGGRAALAANTLDHSRAGVGVGGGTKQSFRKTSQDRGRKIYFFLGLSEQTIEMANVSDFQINLKMSWFWHSLPDCYRVTLELEEHQRCLNRVSGTGCIKISSGGRFI